MYYLPPRNGRMNAATTITPAASPPSCLDADRFENRGRGPVRPAKPPPPLPPPQTSRTLCPFPSRCFFLGSSPRFAANPSRGIELHRYLGEKGRVIVDDDHDDDDNNGRSAFSSSFFLFLSLQKMSDVQRRWFDRREKRIGGSRVRCTLRRDRRNGIVV